MSVTTRRSFLNEMLSARGAVFAVFLYCAINAAITLSAGPALALDDVKLNVLTQSLEAGYLPDNPPVFEWTLIAVQQMLGPSLASFVIVKYLFLCLGAAFTGLAAREASGEARVGAIAVLSLPLVPLIGWSFHQTLTHTTALFAAVALFWFALLRLRRANRFEDYAILGVAIGVGVLAKYSFVPAAAAALAASILDAPLRNLLMSRKALFSLTVAVIVAAPHLAWLASDGADSAALAQGSFVGKAFQLQRVLEGLPALLWAALSFLAPLGVAVWIARRGRMNVFRRAQNVLSDSALIALAGLAVAIIALGIPTFQERYALSFFYPAYLWMIVTVCKDTAISRVAPALLACISALTMMFAAVRLLEVLLPGKPFCEACRQHIPYEYLGNYLASETANGDTLIAFDDHTAGNLRRMFPGARVISSHQPFYAPPAIASGGCLFIWSTDLAPSPPNAVIEKLNSAEVKQVGGAWRHKMNGDVSPVWSLI